MIRIGRRGLLAAFGATIAALGLRPTSLEARARAGRSEAGSGRWLVDESLDARDLASMPVVSPTRLEADLVRQWRDDLCRTLRADPRSATALVRWDKAFVLQGLAREEGMIARVERLSPALFRVTLSARI